MGGTKESESEGIELADNLDQSRGRSGTLRDSFFEATTLVTHKVVESSKLSRLKAVTVFAAVFIFSSVVYLVVVKGLHLFEIICSMTMVTYLVASMMNLPSHDSLLQSQSLEDLKSLKKVRVFQVMVFLSLLGSIECHAFDKWCCISTLSSVVISIAVVALLEIQLNFSAFIKRVMGEVNYKRKPIEESLLESDVIYDINRDELIHMLSTQKESLRSISKNLSTNMKFFTICMFVIYIVFVVGQGTEKRFENRIMHSVSCIFFVGIGVIANSAFFNRKIERMENDFCIQTGLVIKVGGYVINDAWVLGASASLFTVIIRTNALSYFNLNLVV